MLAPFPFNMCFVLWLPVEKNILFVCTDDELSHSNLCAGLSKLNHMSLRLHMDHMDVLNLHKPHVYVCIYF